MGSRRWPTWGRRFHLLLGICLRWASAASVFLLPHTGGNLRPLLQDVRGNAAIGAVVPALLHNEGHEPAPTTHR
jgi:hypothetical protein